MSHRNTWRGADRTLDSRAGRATLSSDRGDGLARFMASISHSPKPEPVIPVARVRGTLLTSSLTALRSRGHIDRYMRLLPEEHHEAVGLVIAGSWVPISLALAHYGACNALGLTAAEQVDIGVDVAARIHGTFLGTITKLATGAGVTPWVGFRQVTRLWLRTVEGGSTTMTEIGPKEARIDVACPPLASNAYFRTAFRGIIQGGCELFSRKAYVRELTAQGNDETMVYRAAWV